MNDKERLDLIEKLTINPTRLGSLIELCQLGEILEEDITIRILNIYERKARKATDKPANVVASETTRIAEIELLKVGPIAIDPVGKIFVNIGLLQVTEDKILTIRPAKSSCGVTSIYMGDPYPNKQE